MPVEFGLWRIDPSLKKIELSGFDLEGRLEDILNSDISMVNPNWMVVGRQVRTAFDKLVDLLCIDRDGKASVESAAAPMRSLADTCRTRTRRRRDSSCWRADGRTRTRRFARIRCAWRRLRPSGVSHSRLTQCHANKRFTGTVAELWSMNGPVAFPILGEGLLFSGP
jgi:hypothetical protein